MTALRPPIGYFGSKVRIAPRIVDLLPDHEGYVEPFAGSLAVLLAKPRRGLEVANDLDGDLVNFWRVLRDRPLELARACALTPHSRAELADCVPIPDDANDLERARRVWCKLAQGRSGTLRPWVSWRYYEDNRGRGASVPDTMLGYVARMEALAERLHAVTLECRPAADVIARYGRVPGNLLYLDPPYLRDVRAPGNYYQHELRDPDEHRELAALAADCRAVVVVSGYPHPLYEQLYNGWHRVELPAGTSQGSTWGNRTEVLWCNRELRRQRSLWVDA